MNVIEHFLKHSESQPENLAFISANGQRKNYRELRDAMVHAQNVLARQYGVSAGHRVLILGTHSPDLYAILLAIWGLGAESVFIEPWMDSHNLELIFADAKPDFFIGSALARLWSLRGPVWRSKHKFVPWAALTLNAQKPADGALILSPCKPEHPAMLSFTGGTTGIPKKVLRSHQQLLSTAEALESTLRLKEFNGPDLSVFPNFSLINLFLGQTSLLWGSHQSEKALRAFGELPESLRPKRIICGPRVFKKCLKVNPSIAFEAIYLGGALMDLSFMAEVIDAYPKARLGLVYGSSEVEPVAYGDLREAFAFAQNRGWFQSLALGQKIAELNYEFHPEHGLKVKGKHVAKVQWAGEEKLPEEGAWHRMGDRIKTDEGWLIYQGRLEDHVRLLELEQKLFHQIKSSEAMLFRQQDGSYIALGSGIRVHREAVLAALPMVTDLRDIRKVHRDRRHRARVDRRRTIRREAPWLLG